VPLLVLGLVLASAVAHAAWNLWAKQLGPGVRQASLLWLINAFAAVCFAPLAWATIARTHRARGLVIEFTQEPADGLVA